MSTFRASAAYFGLAFGAGFALGIARTLWLVPRVGERQAELIEIPFMILVSLLTARFVVGRMEQPALARRVAVGCFALLLLVAAEVGVVWLVRGQSLGAYVETRDPVSGSAYLLALAIFASAPVIVGCKGPPARSSRANQVE